MEFMEMTAAAAPAHLDESLDNPLPLAGDASPCRAGFCL